VEQLTKLNSQLVHLSIISEQWNGDNAGSASSETFRYVPSVMQVRTLLQCSPSVKRFSLQLATHQEMNTFIPDHRPQCTAEKWNDMRQQWSEMEAAFPQRVIVSAVGT
jgi:hypothetical protein